MRALAAAFPLLLLILAAMAMVWLLRDESPSDPYAGLPWRERRRQKRLDALHRLEERRFREAMRPLDSPHNPEDRP